jgi:hypothetical protein
MGRGEVTTWTDWMRVMMSDDFMVGESIDTLAFGDVGMNHEIWCEFITPRLRES